MHPLRNKEIGEIFLVSQCGLLIGIQTQTFERETTRNIPYGVLCNAVESFRDKLYR